MKYLKKYQSVSICYFFCFYNYDDKKRYNNIIELWIFQLIKPINAIAFQIAKKIYKKKKSHITIQIELWQIFQKAIL